MPINFNKGAESILLTISSLRCMVEALWILSFYWNLLGVPRLPFGIVAYPFTLFFGQPLSTQLYAKKDDVRSFQSNYFLGKFIYWETGLCWKQSRFQIGHHFWHGITVSLECHDKLTVKGESSWNVWVNKRFNYSYVSTNAVATMSLRCKISTIAFVGYVAIYGLQYIFHRVRLWIRPLCHW